jgi:hypothetical protein
MLLTAMLIDTFDAALEDRVVAFDGIGVDLSSRSRPRGPYYQPALSDPLFDGFP